MNCLLKALPNFSLQGQARMLEFKGKPLLYREFGKDLTGIIFQLGNQLFELFRDTSGKALMLKPATVKTLDLYLEAVNIQDAFV